MFEGMTYDVILQDMLSRVTSDVDKREGSVIYDALAPAAYHLAQMYFGLDLWMDLVSGDTAVGEYLDKAVADYGISRKPATQAVRKVLTTAAVAIGTRWGVNDTTYTITDLLSTNIYKAVCQQSGEIGNTYAGALDNIDNVSGVTATLTDIITSGQDEETDENLRTRFYTYLQRPSTSGNAYNYREWAMLVPGVGDAKVLPLWNGNGTVKVLVVNSDMEIDNSLEAAVYDYIETVRPIGAQVTVGSPEQKVINMTANIKLDGTATYENVSADFMDLITEYFKDLAFKMQSVSYAKIGSALLSVSGIADYDNLLINGIVGNVLIGETEIPTLGAITLTEVT